MIKNNIKIGNISIDGRVFLAPMAGVSDLPFRKLCRGFGAAMVTTEMVSAKALYMGSQATFRLMQTEKEEKPAAIQIFGSEPDIMGKIGHILDSTNFDIVDINMGCPAPKIIKNGDGSALLREPKLVGQIIRSLSSSTIKPTTVKIRIGYDFENINCVEIAKIAEENGAAAIAVHGRTRSQMYSGEADWEAIARVKEAVNIPVIGNGDIDSAQIAKKRLEEAGVDAIMIARAACGNPWLFKQINHYLETGEILENPSPKEKLALALQHASELIVCKGEHVGIKEMRKHFSWYIKGIKGASEMRTNINIAIDFEEIKEMFTNFLEKESEMFV